MLQRFCRALTAGLEWLRAGYPADQPRAGHSALVALTGPISLSPKQKDCVTAQLDGAPIEITTIEVAITKVTHRLPTPSQTSDMVHLLQQRASRG